MAAEGRRRVVDRNRMDGNARSGALNAVVLGRLRGALLDVARQPPVDPNTISEDDPEPCTGIVRLHLSAACAGRTIGALRIPHVLPR